MTRGAHADTSCPEVWARCLSPALLPPLPPRDIEPWWSWSSYRSCGVQRWHLAGCHPAGEGPALPQILDTQSSLSEISDERGLAAGQF